MAILRRKEVAFTFDDVLLEPQYSTVASRKDVDISTKLFPNMKLELPILSANMDTVTERDMICAMYKNGGIGVLHRFIPIETQIEIIQETKSRAATIASIGVSKEDIKNAYLLIETGVSAIVIDIAHAHSSNLEHMYKHGIINLIRDFPFFIAGNVATVEGAQFLIDLGFKCIKVGIGSGSICTTRLVTGFGVPQLTAIMECAAVCKRNGVTLIADGGIRTSGDIVKALAAGADAVMLGSMLAGTDEAPGTIVERQGNSYKCVRGMASLGANISRKELSGLVTEEYISSITPEGVEALVPYSGPVKTILNQLAGGIRSGLSYCGAHNIKELQEKAVFIPITNSGLKESHSHDVIL